MLNEQAIQQRRSAQKDSDVGIRVRPFPYPYKAALAISNDLDGIRTFREMKAIHDILNGRKMTPCGPGLGLEVSNSLHFFSVHPEQDETLSYFEDTSDKPSSDAPALRQGIESGLLDSLHTWGNFSQKGGFFRKHAQLALEELQKYNLRISVWTNHGDRHNFQNLGRADSLGDVREVSSVRGDRSQVLEYHTDLARQLGVRYIWIKGLTQIVGQERPLNLQDWVGRGVLPGYYWLRSLAGKDQSVIRTERASGPAQIKNNLIRSITLRDGSSFYEILRYGFFHKDGSDNLPEILSLTFLRRLVETGGACLLYTHLGKGRPSPETPFSRDGYGALARLAQWAGDGQIWVTTVSRLCNYIELCQRLKLRSVSEENGLLVSGEFELRDDLSDPNVAGLTFYGPQTQSCKLKIGELEYTPVVNPADHTGRISFSVPLAPLSYCWE